MELGSISDTSLQTPTSNRAATPTPGRSQASTLPASGLRKEVPPAQESNMENNSGNQEPIESEVEGQQVNRAFDRVGDVFGSQESRSSGVHSGNVNSSTNLPFQVGPSHDRPESRSSLLSHGGLAPQYAESAAQPWRDTQSTNVGLGAVSPRTYHALFGNGVHPVENIINRSSAPPAPPLGPSFGNEGFVSDSSSSNTAMLNGMYSLLSGNIHNLQLPEYQQWLHAVAQNQQLLANLTGGTPITSHMPITSTSTEQPFSDTLNGMMNTSAFNANGMPNVPWDNLSMGVDFAAAPDVNGAMADIWSMAPNNFE